ncbi:hypothetical protein EMIHUDRAFT_460679, partial [Emiliania huxleyi CCMP1516]|uniref:SMC hinge domain-containing protein n=2 Tax=Emiliania huxleyi TaxID=2903 RepID=A0A0D3K7E7_EMIH1
MLSTLRHAGGKRKVGESGAAADEGSDDGDGYAVKMLQRLLDVARPKQATSRSLADTLELVVEEWSVHAAEMQGTTYEIVGGEERANAKKNLRRGSETKSVMSMVLELVSKLQTSAGRAALVDMYGAKHECADDAEMANDDDDVDASRCVPPAGTKVALCKLAAHTVMNEQCGTIAGYSAEADRYVVQLEDGTRVRVCRGNLRLEALTTHDFAHAIGETCTVFSRLAARHGASMTSELVGALLQLPSREWTVMKDLVAVDYAWEARTQEGVSLHSLGAPPSHKAQKTNSGSYDRLSKCSKKEPGCAVTREAEGRRGSALSARKLMAAEEAANAEPVPTDAGPVEEKPKDEKPKEIKKVSKPDDALLKQRLQEQDDKLVDKQARLEQIKATVDTRNQPTENAEFTAARSKFNVVRAESRRLLQEKRSIYDQISSADELKKQQQDLTQRLKAELQFFSVEDIERKIKALEMQQQTTSTSVKEDKKIIEDIKRLAANKPMIKQFDEAQESLRGVKEHHNELYTQLKAKNAELNSSKEEEEKWRAEMDAAKAKEDAKRSDLPALYKERDQLRKEI